MPVYNSNDSGSFMQAPAHTLMDARTFAMGCLAFHPTAPAGATHTTLMARGDLASGNLNHWTLGPNQTSAQVRFAYRAPSNTQYNAIGPTAPTGRWYNVIGRLDGRTVDLFIDGALVASTAMTEVTGSSTANIRLFQRTDGTFHGDTVLAHVWFMRDAPSRTECARIGQGEDPRSVRLSSLLFYHSLQSPCVKPDFGNLMTLGGSLLKTYPGPIMKPLPLVVPRLYAGVPQGGSPSVNAQFFFAAA